MTLGRWRLAVGVIVSTMAAAGCGASRSQPAAPASPAAAPDLARVGEVVFPSTTFHADGRVIAEAEQQLVHACMARRKFTYPLVPVQPAPPGSGTPTRTGGYGLYAEFRGLVAQRDPHADITRLLRLLSPGRRAKYLRSLEGSPTQSAVLTVGSRQLRYPTGGCVSRATQRLWGQLERYYRYIAIRNGVVGKLAASLDEDRELTAATATWRRCMSTRGLRYATPAEARAQLYNAYLSSNAQRVRTRELATATADRACARRSHVYAQATRAQLTALRALPATQLRALAASARDRRVAAQTARALLSRRNGRHRG